MSYVPESDSNPYASPQAYVPPVVDAPPINTPAWVDAPPINTPAWVVAPAITLIVIGALNALYGLFYVVAGIAMFFIGIEPGGNPADDPASLRMFEMMQSAYPIINVGLGAVVLLGATVTIFGALRMKAQRSHGWALAAAITSMVPIVSPCCIVGLPIGIWAIVVLNNAQVRAMFRP